MIWPGNQDRRHKRRCGFELYGYCLMDNHIHLLVKEAANAAVLDIGGSEIEIPPESLESIFKRIGVSYVLYFNRKYKRVGHLFQDRFKSEPIERASAKRRKNTGKAATVIISGKKRTR